MVGYCEMMLQFSPQNHLYVQRNLDKGRFHPVPWLQGNDGGTMQGRMNATATPYVWCLKGFAVHLAIGKLQKDHHTSSQNATIMVLMTMMMITSSPRWLWWLPIFSEPPGWGQELIGRSVRATLRLQGSPRSPDSTKHVERTWVRRNYPWQSSIQLRPR